MEPFNKANILKKSTNSKQFLNELGQAGYEEFLRLRFVLSAEAFLTVIQTEALIIPHILPGPSLIIALLFIGNIWRSDLRHVV